MKASVWLSSGALALRMCREFGMQHHQKKNKEGVVWNTPELNTGLHFPFPSPLMMESYIMLGDYPVGSIVVLAGNHVASESQNSVQDHMCQLRICWDTNKL